jgi:deoxyribodipyrimidine photolyase
VWSMKFFSSSSAACSSGARMAARIASRSSNQHSAAPSYGGAWRAYSSGRTWNAAQPELVRDDRIHNYVRMLWGKKVLEWSPSAEEALERMIHLNNKYTLDGRDPHSFGGIFWVLGRYDRPWGPRRPIFGTVR